MDYLSVSMTAQKWGISPRRVRLLCVQDKIFGVIKVGKLYKIPADAPKPIDGRKRRRLNSSGSLSSLFLRIDALRDRLDQSRPLTAGELERLREEFLINFTYDSNAIEGNTLTLNETSLVLLGITIDQKPLKDHLEAIGHRDAFSYIVGIAKEGAGISESVIKTIHSLILLDRPLDRGVYRKIQVRISGATNEPCLPLLIEQEMQQLLLQDEQNKTWMHHIERIARFHLEFERIHPFIDGNGRTGRLIMNLDLIQSGFPPINVKFADRKKYYQAFNSYYSTGDAGEMIELIASYVDKQLGIYLDLVEQ